MVTIVTLFKAYRKDDSTSDFKVVWSQKRLEAVTLLRRHWKSLYEI